MNNEARVQPTRRITTCGIVIVLGGAAAQALPAGAGMPVIDQRPLLEVAEADDV